MTTPYASPTAAERFRFDTQGYLAPANVLQSEHIAARIQAGHRAVAKRRALLAEGLSCVGHTRIRDRDTRLFYILDEDPLFLEMLDRPAIRPYRTGQLNARLLKKKRAAKSTKSACVDFVLLE